MTLRQDKLGVLFKKLIAQFLGPYAEGSVVTVVQCVVSRDIKHAKAFIAIYPQNKENDVVLSIQEKQKELQDFLRKNTRMKSVPRVMFIVDRGEEQREKINKLLGAH